MNNPEPQTQGSVETQKALYAIRFLRIAASATVRRHELGGTPDVGIGLLQDALLATEAFRNITPPPPARPASTEGEQIFECECLQCRKARGIKEPSSDLVGHVRQKTIYLASRYNRSEQMRAARAELEVLGYQITSRWIDGGHELSKEGSTQAHETERTRFAQEDWSDMLCAETVINFTEEPRTTKTRGGRHVEFGGALALGKRVIVIGHRENVFHCLPSVEFYPTWPECLNALIAPSVGADGSSHAARVSSLNPATEPEPSDTERLDWLDNEKPLVQEDVRDGTLTLYAAHPSGKGAYIGTGKTFREAIDSAMKSSRETSEGEEK